MSRPDEAGGVSGRESAPRGASGDGSRMDEPTSSANLDGTRGSAPGTPIVEACEHFWVKPDGAGPSTRECTLCGAVTALLLVTAGRRGDWMSTFTGRRFYPLDPRPEDFDIRDIAHALANICRFGGHARTFYSVAQHSVIVAGMTEHAEHRMQGLLHDAAEAYLGDVVRPIKYHAEFDAYRAIELRLEDALFARWAYSFTSWPCVKAADERALATEARDLMRGSEEWSLRASADPVIRIAPWPAEHAEKVFLDRFERYGGQL